MFRPLRDLIKFIVAIKLQFPTLCLRSFVVKSLFQNHLKNFHLFSNGNIRISTESRESLSVKFFSIFFAYLCLEMSGTEKNQFLNIFILFLFLMQLNAPRRCKLTNPCITEERVMKGCSWRYLCTWVLEGNKEAPLSKSHGDKPICLSLCLSGLWYPH